MASPEDEPPEERGPMALSGAARVSSVATLGYLLVSVGHCWLLRTHLATGAEGRLFTALAAVEVALAVEAAVFAIGGLGRPCGLPALALAGRLRLLGAAAAWPWLLPWAAELGCRCGALTTGVGAVLVHQSVAVAVLIDGFFGLCEASFLVRGEPPSALGAAGGQPLGPLGDCLPSQAVLGGHFRLDKADLEETGRAVFVPARPRPGLYVGAGLAMLGSLLCGLAMAHASGPPPWLLLGSVGALLGRRLGRLPEFKGREGARVLWRREGPRLLCRFGELFWLLCCVWELQRCMAKPTWLAACE